MKTEPRLSSNENQGVWNAHSRRWQNVGPPLRPSPEDGEMMLRLARPFLADATTPATVAILGVTPEVVQLSWPAHVRLRAFDMSAGMIAKVWAPHAELPSEVHERRWQDLPLADGSVACAVGDGSLNALPSLAEFPDVLSEIARVLDRRGALILRMFIRPEARAALGEVEQSVWAGRIKSFHALKWHVAMAIAEAPDYSVKVSDIRAKIIAMFPDRERLAALHDWPRPVIDAIDSYDGVDTRYTFPPLDAVRKVSSPFFELAGMQTGSYEIAERCPTVLFRLR